ncbi:GNAT family N-acetyltransferase [Paenibacillus glucanolyticus]|jgi:ribosomal protein S18 acetylase RimI-like enzyme|uniref:Acetyltransferase n=1 Tax=Paenibacillus glucanolyticus TaxID=59843 RepID=A0A163FRT4_9BACL|nr:GNAT family N-acetyltransferase [Paenibacillus glucanolyticus]ANA79132.1 acetyltransferase [Paenibacillus glucanolyticus]KZS44536.1 acetyltransferase [Paenibacillus glucanolyticus]OMF78145.1 GNAT family N-acetyltransferase [Paenibacillus glucanolyticus]
MDKKDVGCLKAEIYVYRAELQDLGKAAGLFNQYRQFYKRDDDLSGAEQYIRERLTQGDSVIYLAVSKTADTLVPAGYVQLYPSLSSLSMSRIWILNDLFVDSDYRGHGIGRKLLDQAKMHAVQTGAKGLTLSTQLHNLKAQRLYESAGYARDDEFVYYNLNV